MLHTWCRSAGILPSCKSYQCLCLGIHTECMHVSVIPERRTLRRGHRSRCPQCPVWTHASRTSKFSVCGGLFANGNQFSLLIPFQRGSARHFLISSKTLSLLAGSYQTLRSLMDLVKFSSLSPDASPGVLSCVHQLKAVPLVIKLRHPQEGLPSSPIVLHSIRTSPIYHVLNLFSLRSSFPPCSRWHSGPTVGTRTWYTYALHL